MFWKNISVQATRRSPIILSALATGANGYLIKPAPVRQMLHAIETVLAGEIYLPQCTWEMFRHSLQGPSELLSKREREVLHLKHHREHRFGPALDRFAIRTESRLQGLNFDPAL
jgi:DNA-binding NarL/FixJ family response regulator